MVCFDRVRDKALKKNWKTATNSKGKAITKKKTSVKDTDAVGLELVSKKLNHFGVIADLFRQIGGHST